MQSVSFIYSLLCCAPYAVSRFYIQFIVLAVFIQLIVLCSIGSQSVLYTVYCALLHMQSVSFMFSLLCCAPYAVSRFYIQFIVLEVFIQLIMLCSIGSQ